MKEGLVDALLNDGYKHEINITPSKETKRIWRFNFICHLGAGICWQPRIGVLTISILFLNVYTERVPKRKDVTIKYESRI